MEDVKDWNQCEGQQNQGLRSLEDKLRFCRCLATAYHLVREVVPTCINNGGEAEGWSAEGLETGGPRSNCVIDNCNYWGQQKTTAELLLQSFLGSTL